MEGFYLRTMRYYRPDYSWLMFLVWEITFTIFFSSSFFLSFFFPWSAQALELKMRIALNLSCFFTSPLQWVVLVLVVVFCWKDFCFPLLLAPAELLDTSRGVFSGRGFMTILSEGNDFFIPRSIVLIIDSKEKT